MRELRDCLLLLGALAVATVLAILAGGDEVRSQTAFEKLVMPGPLSNGHAKLEQSCEKCHEPFSRASQSGLCLGCHKDIAGDRSQRKGLHGRLPAALNGDCKSCHTEHKGRNADIVQLDTDTFTHRHTNFELKGLHTSLSCEKCHKQGELHRKAPSRCSECHQAQDAHKGNLGSTCEGCHSENGWKNTKQFDHSKTRFALVGAHKRVTCAICHVGERYKDLPRTCVACHKSEDKHAGRNGAKCETCHNVERWSATSFNHNKNTRFPLKGKHAEVKCEACHTAPVQSVKPSSSCSSCHAKNDPHKGSLGASCQSCHSEAGWRRSVSFDHDATRFPLIGRHAVAACESCHRSSDFKDVQRSCSNCHADTHHKGRFSANCAQCHNPNGWKRWLFDHDKQTVYPLTGAHRQLTCHACHTAPRTSSPSGAGRGCIACHQSDDAHQGAFGANCGQCHTTSTFKAAASIRR